MRKSKRSPAASKIHKITCSKTRRTLRARLYPINGTALTHANKPLSPLPGRANTNSGQRSPASTTYTATGICSVPARQWKNSKNNSQIPPLRSESQRPEAINDSESRYLYRRTLGDAPFHLGLHASSLESVADWNNDRPD